MSRSSSYWERFQIPLEHGGRGEADYLVGADAADGDDVFHWNIILLLLFKSFVSVVLKIYYTRSNLYYSHDILYVQCLAQHVVELCLVDEISTVLQSSQFEIKFVYKNMQKVQPEL